MPYGKKSPTRRPRPISRGPGMGPRRNPGLYGGGRGTSGPVNRGRRTMGYGQGMDRRGGARTGPLSRVSRPNSMRPKKRTTY